jgi:adenosylcobinamide kinase/adenosylcobinamide-phosphate guanylyltransferase
VHVFIGGAHNGKRKYVKKWLANRGENKFNWVDGINPYTQALPIIVLAGIENWVIETDLSEEEIANQIMKIGNQQELVLIVTDIGRGIVPVDAEERKRRDVCGRIYQYLMGEAEEVTRIWYGLAQPLKRKGELV